MDRRIKLRHIETFAQIARDGSLKLAGERLGLTQPAVSKTLKDLEQILGAELMSRGRGGVELTAAGRLFLRAAEASLGALRQGFDGTRQLVQGGGGRLGVGAMASVAARVLPQATLGFLKSDAATVLHVEDGPHGYLTDRLREGALSLVVGRMGPPKTMQGISFTQLYQERVVAVVRRGHALSGARHLAELHDHPLIYPSRDAAIRPLVDRLFIGEGLGVPQRRIESVSSEYGRALVRESAAVWLISESVVAADVASGVMERLPLVMELTAGPVGVMMRAGEAPSALAELSNRIEWRKLVRNTD